MIVLTFDIMPTIMLIDMDYFFAACEELRKPEIRSKPVVVGADPKKGMGRGVVSTCNYKAREFGIHSGMPISIAYRLKPDAVFLPVDDAYYESMSDKVMKIIKEYAEKFEQASIDEAFIDVSKAAPDKNSAIELAQTIKERIYKELGLPCSIGIGPNKLIAKMACEAAKPNGIKYVSSEEAKQFIADMPIGKLYGVGKKTAIKLESMGYKKVADLAKANLQKLISALGTYGIELYNYANGKDESPVQENYEIKSIGREHTFEKDTANEEEIEEAIAKLAKEVASDASAKGFAFSTVTLKLRYANFEEHLKSKGIGYSSKDERDVENTAISLFKNAYERGEPLRKIGVRVSGLTTFKGQKSLRDYL